MKKLLLLLILLLPLQVYAQNYGANSSYPAFKDTTNQSPIAPYRVVATEGATINILGNNPRIIVDPSASLNALTLVLDQNNISTNGDEYKLLFTQNIVSLTLKTYSGTTIAIISNISAGRNVVVWNYTGTFYAGVN